MASRAAGFRGRLVVGALSACSLGVACGESTTEQPRAATAGDASAGGESAAQGGESGVGSHSGGTAAAAGEAMSAAGISAAGGAMSAAGGAMGAAGGAVSAAGGAMSAAGGAAAGDAMSAAGAAQAGQGGEEPSPVPPPFALRSISISQTEELPLMNAGRVVDVAERPAPLVAGKRALVRVFFDLDPSFASRELLGALDLQTPEGTRTHVTRLTPTQSSLQDDLATSFDFSLNAEDLSPDSTYRVRVLEADTTPLARFPEDGYLQLGARVLPVFQLVMVPFVANGFAPRTTEVETAALRQRLLALYPSVDIAITVLDPVTLPYVVNADAKGWDNALDRIYQLRSEAEPAHDVYYFGALAPAPSYSAYCTGACILGFSKVGEESDADARGSIGVTIFPDGSGGKDAWNTVAHELGHAMGRDHAPCGVADPKDIDPDYPYPNGGMGGIYGFDFDLMRLVKPRSSKDVMGYCTPVWISAYTYSGLFERLDYIASERFRALAFTPEQPFRLARVRRTGESVWLGQRRRNGRSRLATLDLLGPAGQRLGSVDAQVVAVDHAPGGYVWLHSAQLSQSGAHSVDLRPLGGSVLPL